MRQVKRTVKLLRRSPYQALAATLAMALTFFVSSIFIVLILGGQIILNYLEQRPEVMAFFKDEVSEVQIAQIITDVKSTNLVKDVKYITKEEALEIYKERNKDEPLLLDQVTADILPSSINVSVNRAGDIIEITKILKDRQEVEKVVAPENLVEQLTKWTKTIRIGGLIFISTLLSISFLIIIMVIGMRIAIRREEISIMNLVGATKFYIAKPFFLEGALYGFIGASIATFLIYCLLLFYSPAIQEFLGPIKVFPISPLFFVYLWVGEALLAAFVGILGAAIALTRYLKIK